MEDYLLDSIDEHVIYKMGEEKRIRLEDRREQEGIQKRRGNLDYIKYGIMFLLMSLLGFIKELAQLTTLKPSECIM